MILTFDERLEVVTREYEDSCITVYKYFSLDSQIEAAKRICHARIDRMFEKHRKEKELLELFKNSSDRGYYMIDRGMEVRNEFNHIVLIELRA